MTPKGNRSFCSQSHLELGKFVHFLHLYPTKKQNRTTTTTKINKIIKNERKTLNCIESQNQNDCNSCCIYVVIWFVILIWARVCVHLARFFTHGRNCLQLDFRKCALCVASLHSACSERGTQNKHQMQSHNKRIHYANSIIFIAWVSVQHVLSRCRTLTVNSKHFQK